MKPALVGKVDRRKLVKGAAAFSVGMSIRPAVSEERPKDAVLGPKFRVLSLDGGGARGYLSVQILANIEQYLDEYCANKLPLGQRFDLIAGTSTGGIIALGLATGATAGQILRFYETLVPKVFSADARRNWATRLKSPKYDSGPLSRALSDYFGDKTLGDVQTDVCITAVALRNGKPRFHKSDYQRRDGARIDEKLSDVALATSAAPTYFGAHNLKHSDRLIDGGICANNPAVVALVDAVRFDRPSKRGTEATRSFSRVVMVSVGTGEQPLMPYDAEAMAQAGLLDWAQHISDVMFESQSWVAHFQAQFLLGDNYLRINPKLGLAMEMDDINHLSDLRNIADIGDIEERFMQKHFF
jgi:patatin-like phospholipase/acyl hydrolase